MSNRVLSSAPARLLPRHLSGKPSWATIRAAWRRQRSRQRIAALDGQMLKDIGVTFAEAEAEANKPIWRA